MRRSAVAAVGMAAASCLVAGCASPEMKGTPFYSGEYETRLGPPEDRVNAWPLFYRREPATSVCWPIGEMTDDHFAVRPLFSIYGLDDAQKVYNVLWPIGQFDTVRDRHRMFPAFWGEEYRALFPVYWHEGEPLGVKGGWDALLPLWCLRTDSSGYCLDLPWPFLRVQKRSGTESWRLWPLAGSSTRAGRSYGFFLWPLGHRWSAGGQAGRGSALIPVYWHQSGPARSLFLSLPWCAASSSDGSEWQFVPLLYAHAKDRDREWRLTPLFGGGTSDGGRCRWSAVMPFYYDRRSDAGRAFATLAGGFRTDSSGRRWMIYPLLSGGRLGKDEGEVWIGAPLVHAAWDPDGTSHHLFPLYWWDGHDRDLLSPLVCRWKDKRGADRLLVPPLLSWLTRTDRRSDLWVLGPAAHLSWGEEAGARHVFPFFYGNAQKEFYTPLFGWRDDPETGFVYPLTPLVGLRRGRFSGGWLFPLFSHRRDRRTGQYARRILWAGYERDAERVRSSMFPFYSYHSVRLANAGGAKEGSIRGSSFWCLPACWRRDQVRVQPDWQARHQGDRNATVTAREKSNGVFPLWSYSSVETPEQRRTEVAGSILLALYDHRRTSAPAEHGSGATDDYVRSRVLWRLWHYERRNDAVSVDLFPAVTYDRKGDEFRKVNFLWRFFRYERSREGTKADLLFVPVWRSREGWTGAG